MPRPVALVLASASPRRAQLLRQLGLTFEVCRSEVPEEVPPGLPAEQAVCRLARAKAEAVAAGRTGGVVLGADTVVAVGGRILGKPVDAAAARGMLTLLSGRSHMVHTGIALKEVETGRCLTASEVTRVYMRPMEPWEIAAYVDSGEPLDKAGAYAVQGLGSIFVERIEGCFFNVVGLPLFRLAGLLRAAGLEVLPTAAPTSS
ncbi:MAG: Maf family protein [Thermaerobacter sp.]|nr:Maf family protein [Thermaerobacter sp.]